MYETPPGTCAINLIPSDYLSHVSDDLFGIKVAISFTFEPNFVQAHQGSLRNLRELFFLKEREEEVFRFELKREVGLFGDGLELLVFFGEGLVGLGEFVELFGAEDDVVGSEGIDKQPDVGGRW